MSWGFERGRVYNRRTDFHARFRGQQQGGIITPTGFPIVAIVTGEAGLVAGYHDQWRSDGVFEYFGEGWKGDMLWLRGNRAIRDHLADGKDLLLFQKTRLGLKFEGEMICQGFHYRDAPDAEGQMRKAIVFELRELESVVEQIAEIELPTQGNLVELERRAFEAAREVGETRTQTRNVYERSRDVRDYVLARAGFSCEGCGNPAPFLRPNGTPYLEPHHLRRLSDGGPDDPRHVISLCPTCHRRVHHGIDGQAYNDELIAKMNTIQRKIWV